MQIDFYRAHPYEKSKKIPHIKSLFKFAVVKETSFPPKCLDLSSSFPNSNVLTLSKQQVSHQNVFKFNIFKLKCLSIKNISVWKC